MKHPQTKGDYKYAIKEMGNPANDALKAKTKRRANKDYPKRNTDKS